MGRLRIWRITSGRVSGSAQAAKAVEYIAGELKSLGCTVQLEKVMVPHWVRGEETAALVQFPGQAPNTTQKIVLCALGGSVPTPAQGTEAEVIVVKNFDELKSLPRDEVAGRIVLFNYPFDKQMAAQGRSFEAYGEAVVYRSHGPSAAARKGAVACLVRSVGSADYRLPHTGETDYASDAPKIPAGAVTAEDADLISNLIRQGPVKIKLILTPQTLPDVESANVVADIKGSEHPEQVIIVSGHLDSWDLGTGAIDDGAGVAVSMEAANLIQKLHLKPKRTIRVIAWMNEENGETGSKQYAKDHDKETSNHFAAMETDSGAGHPIGVNIKARPEVKNMLAPVSVFCSNQERAYWILLNTAVLTLSRSRKPACRLSVRFRTAASISITITLLPIRWIKSRRKNWRKIPRWSRLLRMRWRTWKSLCLVN